VDRNTASPSPRAPKTRSVQPLVWIVLLCLSPVVAALLAYYVPSLGLRPNEGTNYGHLVSPQRPTPSAAELGLTTLDGKPFDLKSLEGKWVLMTADQGACPESCVEKLFILRNAHASQGKNVDRLTRVWFITDDAAIPSVVQEAYKGTVMVRADATKLAQFLTTDTVKQPPADPAQALKQPMWIIDPLGNLMLEFPPDDGTAPEERGQLVRKDIGKLLYNSRIG
jgi:cytochrome oxidase Cu insertion factor (SCO1/SenC/PrrC family)